MAFRAVVVAVVVALASAGMDPQYMNMFGGGMMNNMMNMNMGQMQQGGGCQNGGGGAGCQLPNIPQADMAEYLEQQMKQQQFETQQMAEKIKAQFEKAMEEATMKKHRYAMSVMTEYTSICACYKESYNIYQTMFVESAKNLNMTDVVDLNDMNTLPYLAKSDKEAKELMFAGLVKAICTSLGTYMSFAQQVEDRIPFYVGQGK